MGADASETPLADRMRPGGLDGFAGQVHLLAPGKPLRQAIDTGRLHSMIFWGPPGTGKTTLARLVAARSGAHFINLSAVLAGVKDIREAVTEARARRSVEDRATVLFIDEVHRFNKGQQDAFLPHVEDGTLTFIGATTENPSFELNNALLSRARVYVLKPLSLDDLTAVLRRALADPVHGLGARDLALSAEGAGLLAEAADGDARRALNLLELAANLSPGGVIGAETVAAVMAGALRRFDKGGDLFHDQISALHKSIRGSAPDAALYWLARMIDGGCDPLYIARRLVRMASEDIGNADPRALALAVDAWDTQERLGSPEGELALAQAAVYLACAAKSNAVYLAWNAALADARRGGTAPVPPHLRNAPTRLMKALGHGRAYRYAHDEPGGYAAGERYFPEELGERRYYEPTDRGLEIRIREKLERLRALDQAARDAAK
ncbi:replication-associated recombination protein A [Candidatus Thiodictyon syntrophicum]|jgi:putative ATPase|uniref:Replication-associated recombination protein A n=1 Tax=Candidatus Thiodictyon syntrophicum TaxID=1166950 RepID=A0A2K8U4D4_9GAMM|nr:replication-associated recombination protein A [Candidatus Thiodictyon syntrophicum]AUB80442.1 recombination factor protein RarA [Candidatus Thiodictyon syntrophicum]